MKINIFSNKKSFFIILFVFSFIINQYYGNLGIFPIDSFAHFDSGFRILLGEYPFKDYWIVSGPLVDYLQALFFYFFGVSWQVYIFHASLLNAILTIATFGILTNFNFNIFYSFIYSLLFSILAYTSSGTPFVDHHAAFFTLLGIYSLLLAIKSDKKIYWILLPILFIFAFLSKQVPSTYVIIPIILILFLFSIVKKKYYWIKYCFFCSFFSIFLLIIFAKFQEIPLYSFLEQYILYPQTIGAERFSNFNFSFRGVVDHFKFIYLAFLPLFFINIKRAFFKKDYIKQNDFYYFLIFFTLVISLILHQLLSKNQTFIFFLIPILFAFSHMNLNFNKAHFNKLTSTIMITICFLITFKYHLRFNEGRKFHELQYVNFQLSSTADKIDIKLKGLKWITPNQLKNITRNVNSPEKEIDLLNEVKLHLKADNRIKMLLTNYSFFSVILEEKLFSPSRWHILDGTDYPMKGNKYFIQYKKLFINLIKKNDIKVIYTIYPLEDSVIYTYLDKNCFNKKKISDVLNSYELKKCYEISG